MGLMIEARTLVEVALEMAENKELTFTVEERWHGQEAELIQSALDLIGSESSGRIAFEKAAVGIIRIKKC